MTNSSRTPEGDDAYCPICDTNFVLEPSLFFGDAPCPNCGQLAWFIRLGDRVHTETCGTYTERLADYLDRRGLRVTRQRQTLARLVMLIPSPFIPEQLAEIARQLPDDNRISTTTVYRTLGEFVDAGMVTYTGDGLDRHYIRN